MNVTHPVLYSNAAARSNGRTIGAILVDTGRLSPDNAENILRLQKKHGKRFGDAAIELGLLSADEVNFALASQFEYPYLAPDDDSVSRELIAAYNPFSPVVEQLRVLRSQLMLRWFDDRTRGKSLAIVSPGQGDGRSHIAANLAIVFSQLGERTLLIDADLRQPRQHELFKLGNTSGLSELLAGRSENAAVVVRIQALLGLSVMPAGAVPPNPQELLGRHVFAETLQSLADDFDVIVIDTPAAGHYADAQIVAARAGAALLVGRTNRSTIQSLSVLSNTLQQAGTTLVGSVLNDA